MSTTAELLAKLRDYEARYRDCRPDGGWSEVRRNDDNSHNPWGDVIGGADIDEAATEALDPACESDRFVMSNGDVIRWDYYWNEWRED